MRENPFEPPAGDPQRPSPVPVSPESNTVRNLTRAVGTVVIGLAFVLTAVAAAIFLGLLGLDELALPEGESLRLVVARNVAFFAVQAMLIGWFARRFGAGKRQP